MNYEDHIKIGIDNIKRYEHPFNSDVFISNRVLELKKEFGLNSAIETGSFIFVTSKFFALNFESFITFEKSKELFDEYGVTIDGLPNVARINSGSEEGLIAFNKHITDKTIMFLDAHWDENCPLPRELEIIAETGNKPILLIHDFKVPKTDRYFYSFDGNDLDEEYVKPFLDKIYGEEKYSFEYPEKVGKFNVGAVFILPK